MSETKSTETELGGRIDTLETRISYLDETIDTLNTTISAQWKQIDALNRLIAQLSERVQESDTSPSDPANEPPPHY